VHERVSAAAGRTLVEVALDAPFSNATVHGPTTEVSWIVDAGEVQTRVDWAVLTN
jgi:hypothetical protein